MEHSSVKTRPDSTTRGSELEGILEVIELYKEGVRNGDVDTLNKAFHPQSSMFGWKGEDLFVTPIQGLFDYVGSTPVPAETGEPINFVVTALQVTGKTASVEMVMDNYHDHNFVDYFQLLKSDGRWQIVSKSFHADPQ